MSKDWDTFILMMKRRAPDISALSMASGDKLKKQLQSNLKTAWDKEDALSEALKTAKTAGATGKSISDFQKEKPVATALADWKKAIAAYRANVHAIDAFGKSARDLCAAIDSAQTPIEKDVKKSKVSGAPKKAVTNALKASAAAVKDLKKAGKIFGTLKAEEVYYAMKLKASVDKIVAEAIKEAGGATGDASKLVEEPVLRKNATAAAKMCASVLHLCDTARDEAAENIKKAKGSLTLAERTLKKLGQINDNYQAAEKALAKALKTAKNKKFILDGIKGIKSAHDDAASEISQTAKDLKNA